MDKKRPEPPKLARLVAVIGGVVALPVAFAELGVMKLAPSDPYASAMFMAFVVAATLEETAKLLVVRATVWNRPEFDERMDGLVYFARAGLGFALVENVLYMLGQVNNLGSLIVVGAIRAFFSVPGHALWPAITGYCAARRRFDGTGIGTTGGLVIAILCHGLFDASLMTIAVMGAYGLPLLCIPIALVIGGVIAVRVLRRRALALDDADPRLTPIK
jgi:RsiW-degrading membrane proteinase PrsW (M82 family)